MKPTLTELSRMTGNPDVYAVQRKNGEWFPVREPLTVKVLRSHLEEKTTIGTYIGHKRDDVTVARTLVFDFDTGDEARAEAEAALAALEMLGLDETALAIEFSGRKGYHVWLVLEEYVPNADLRRVGRAALAIAGLRCEMFPKQDEVRDLGNLVKLPGGIHQVTEKANEFIDRVPKPLSMHVWNAVLAEQPAELRARRDSADSRFPCMAAIQNEGCEEGSRNIQLFHLATMLKRAGVSDSNVDLIIRRTNEIGDPLDDTELDALLSSAAFGGPICDQIPEQRQCGELCIKARTSGLYTRPGQLRWAGEGERVVMVAGPRKGNVVELQHDDAVKAKAVIRGD